VTQARGERRDGRSDRRRWRPLLPVLLLPLLLLLSLLTGRELAASGAGRAPDPSALDAAPPAADAAVPASRAALPAEILRAKPKVSPDATPAADATLAAAPAGGERRPCPGAIASAGQARPHPGAACPFRSRAPPGLAA
jgi:hypothetical protein